MSQSMTWYYVSDTDPNLLPLDNPEVSIGELDPYTSSTLTAAPSLRGMAYGDGFFTTLGVYRGQVLHLAYHQARVQNHGQALFLDLPQAKQDLLWQHTKEQATRITHGIIKIIVSRTVQPIRGYGHATKLDENTALVWIGISQTSLLANEKAEFLSLKQPSGLLGAAGSVILQQPPITATCLSSQLASWPKPLGGLKTLNRLDGVLIAGELQRLKQTHPDVAEGLVRDMNGNWVEGVMSNVFYQLQSGTHDATPNGQWYTPPIEHAGVSGTMRQAIIDRLNLLDQPVILRKLQDADLTHIRSMFFCNAVRGVMPVEALILDGKRYELSKAVHY